MDNPGLAAGECSLESGIGIGSREKGVESSTPFSFYVKSPRARFAGDAVTGVQTVTGICRGLASSRLGSVTVSTPFLRLALMFSLSTVPGSRKLRYTLP